MRKSPELRARLHPRPGGAAGARRSRDVGRDLARLAAVLGAAVLLVATPHCLWDGLDDYSSQYGKTTSGDDGGTTDAPEIATDADADADASEDAPPDPSCPCPDGQECVLGKCETCTPMWTREHGAFQNDNLLPFDQAYDPARRAVYVTGARQVGENAPSGYFAEVNPCLGTVVRAHDGDLVSGVPMPGLTLTALPASPSPGVTSPLKDSVFGEVLVKVGDLGGFVRYDATTRELVVLAKNTKATPVVTGGAPWGVAATSKSVWMSGVGTVEGVSRALAMQSDGLGNFCIHVLPGGEGFVGRAVTAFQERAYVTADSPTSVRVWSIDDTVCDVATCTCTLPDPLLPLDLASPFAAEARVVGNSLVVAGLTGFPAPKWSGFIAQYVFGSPQWRVVSFERTARNDGIVGLAGDGAFLWAGAFQDLDPADTLTSKATVLRYSLPLSDVEVPKEIAVPSLGTILGLDLDGDGLILTGNRSDSPASGRTVRCTLDQCP